MTAKIFIDGAAGTTGLEIRERLAARTDLTVVALPDAARKDEAARARALNDADLVILCLPDAASRQAVSLIENPNVRVIDASTAFRVAEGWASISGREPLLTRYSAGVLNYDMTLSLRHAGEQLDYRPPISLERGIEATVNWIRAHGHN